MATQKKFGFFGGVFTPSILTILGVIMYMRLGWVVGHSGLVGAIAIILIAHVISVATGLSISSIATNKKVGAGGVYYVLSRSLGLPMGGAIGFALFIATAFSIALYLIGFAENFNPVLGMGSSINDFRVSGTLALLLLTGIVYISTSVAIKSQYLILGAIILSLISVFFGNFDAASILNTVVDKNQEVSFGVLFGIFFPAVTGFTAGIAMSGDLKDPKKDIPIGTMLAIGAGLIVYIGLALYLYYTVPELVLQNNYNVLMDIALYAPLVIAGIWGATLSSALGGLLGGPRILQAMSVDNITPYSKTFAQGIGASNEPRNALLVTIAIAEVGVLIGELDAIARLVSMFYLMAYSFINLSFFLESWANSDFSPSFKVSKWVGAVGFLATFTVMFQIDPIAMVLAYILLFGLYVYLKRKEMSLNTGDIWGSVWSSVVKTGLKRMDGMEEHQNYWRPNILLFSGGTDQRHHLLEFSKDLGGRTGLISNFDLIESPDAKVLFPKREKRLKNNAYAEKGIFSRRQEVQDIYQGIETIASVYGFSGIEPNTVVMGWPRNSSNPVKFAHLTQSLIDLDYNVLYLDYDKKRGFGNYSSIDIWWRGISNNVILTIRLVKFITASQRWANAKVRVLLVNENPAEQKSIQQSIHAVLSQFRLSADIKIINNHTDKQPIYGMMKTQSSQTDLVFIGVPEKIYDEATYVEKTNNLLDNIGTTLMVRASSQFSETRLGLTDTAPNETATFKTSEIEQVELTQLSLSFDGKLQSAFSSLHHKLQTENAQFTHGLALELAQFNVGLFSSFTKYLEQFFEQIETKKSFGNFKDSFNELHKSFEKFADEVVLPRSARLEGVFEEEIEKYLAARTHAFSIGPERLHRTLSETQLIIKSSDNYDVRWIKRWSLFKRALFNKAEQTIDWLALTTYFDKSNCVSAVQAHLNDLALIELLNMRVLKEATIGVLDAMLTEMLATPENRSQIVHKAKKDIFSKLEKQRASIDAKPKQLLDLFNNRDVELLNEMGELVAHLDVNLKLEELDEDLEISVINEARNKIFQFASDWKQNQELYNKLANTWFTTMALRVEFEYLHQQINRDIHVSMFGMFKRVAIDLERSVVTQSENQTGFKMRQMELLTHNPSDILTKIHERFRSNIRELPEQIEVVEEHALLQQNYFNTQEVEQLEVDLQKITDYYVELDFIEPINRGVAHVYNTLSNYFEELGNRINYANEVFANGQEINEAEVQEVSDQLLIDIKGLKEKIDSSEADFMRLLSAQFNVLNQNLNLSDLMNISANPAKFIHLKKGYKGVYFKAQVAYRNTQKVVLNWFATLRQKQHELKVAEYANRNKTMVNKRKQIRDFVEKNTLSHKVYLELPTYYRHLFSGKQSFNQQVTVQREMELQQALDSLAAIQTGALMIIGEPLSGKSHFVEQLISKLHPPKVVKVNAPAQGIFKDTSLLRTLQESTDLEGSVKRIMEQLPAQTLFVFAKLEQWWLRIPGGDGLIDKINQLVIEYGHKHTFVFTANLHGYDLMRQISGVENILMGTIIMPPANTKTIGKMMLEKQLLSGFEVRWTHATSLSLNNRELLNVFEKHAKLANGNIGVAMLSWMSSIDHFQEGVLYINAPDDKNLPFTLPVGWSVLLTNILLHNVMHIDNINNLFHLQDVTTVQKVIRELRFTKLIIEVSKNTYKIEPYVGKWVVTQLQNEKYLKKFE